MAKGNRGGKRVVEGIRYGEARKGENSINWTKVPLGLRDKIYEGTYVVKKDEWREKGVSVYKKDKDGLPKIENVVSAQTLLANLREGRIVKNSHKRKQALIRRNY